MTKIRITKDNKRWSAGTVVTVQNSVAVCLKKANVCEILEVLSDGNEPLVK